MYDEADLLPLSGLQHLLYCPRQWALIHVERQWAENRFTAEGQALHGRADEVSVEVRPEARVVRALALYSYRLGLSGRADVVIFYPVVEEDLWQLNRENGVREGSTAPAGTALPGLTGWWRPYPVEYKRGRPKADNWDRVQLCAQALCLEEMFGVAIPEGALFYGKRQRRTLVALDEALRVQTAEAAAWMHTLYTAGETPRADYNKAKCDACSLYEHCRPKNTARAQAAGRYVKRMWTDAGEEEDA